SGAAPMEIEEATRETSAEQSKQAAREAAALNERTRGLLRGFREQSEAVLESEWAALLEFMARTRADMATSAVETAFQEARAGVRAFAAEVAREQSTIEELKEMTRAAEARLAAADKGREDQQREVEQLAHEILKSEGSAYRAEPGGPSASPR
ncbi:hypothetical protein LPJ61_004860, partial [Coemansia biformis]